MGSSSLRGPSPAPHTASKELGVRSGYRNGRGGGRRFTAEEKALIVRRYDEGLAACAIAGEVDGTDTAVRRYLLKSGRKLRSNLGREHAGTIRSTGRPARDHLLWAAGFLEGEGSFMTCGYQSHQVTAAQVQREPLERLQASFGGAIRMSLRESPRQAVYRWQCSGSRARGVMLTLYRFLSPRRQGQVRAALRGNREGVHFQLRTLRART